MRMLVEHRKPSQSLASSSCFTAYPYPRDETASMASSDSDNADPARKFAKWYIEVIYWSRAP